MAEFWWQHLPCLHLAIELFMSWIYAIQNRIRFRLIGNWYVQFSSVIPRIRWQNFSSLHLIWIILGQFQACRKGGIYPHNESRGNRSNEFISDSGFFYDCSQNIIWKMAFFSLLSRSWCSRCNRKVQMHVPIGRPTFRTVYFIQCVW